MKKSSKPVLVIITGGTIDKNYNATRQIIELSTHSHIPEMLEIGGATEICSTKQLMLKDSQNITDSDRKKIVNECKKSAEKMIVITHGTDTMVKTAAAIADKKLDKTIVLTGAMRPFPMIISDGLFNLGSAITASQSLKPGVYVVINGRVYDWDNVVKDTINEPHGFITLQEYKDQHPEGQAMSVS